MHVTNSRAGTASPAAGLPTDKTAVKRLAAVSLDHLAVKHEVALKRFQLLLDVRHVVLDGRQHAVKVAHQLQRVADVCICLVVLPDKPIQPAVQRSLCTWEAATSPGLESMQWHNEGWHAVTTRV